MLQDPILGDSIALQNQHRPFYSWIERLNYHNINNCFLFTKITYIPKAQIDTIWLNWVKSEQPSQFCQFLRGLRIFVDVIATLLGDLQRSFSAILCSWQSLRNWFCEVARPSAGSQTWKSQVQVQCWLPDALYGQKIFHEKGKMLQKKEKWWSKWPKASFDKKSSQPPVETKSKLLLIFTGFLYRVVPYQQRVIIQRLL